MLSLAGDAGVGTLQFLLSVFVAGFLLPFGPQLVATEAEPIHNLGGVRAADLAPIIKELQAAGKTSLRAIAEGLNDQGIPTARGGKWSSPQVMRMLERLDPFREEEAA